MSGTIEAMRQERDELRRKLRQCAKTATAERIEAARQEGKLQERVARLESNLSEAMRQREQFKNERDEARDDAKILRELLNDNAKGLLERIRNIKSTNRAALDSLGGENARLEKRLAVLDAALEDARESIAALVPEMEFNEVEVNEKLAAIDHARNPNTLE